MNLIGAMAHSVNTLLVNVCEGPLEIRPIQKINAFVPISPQTRTTFTFWTPGMTMPHEIFANISNNGTEPFRVFLLLLHRGVHLGTDPIHYKESWGPCSNSLTFKHVRKSKKAYLSFGQPVILNHKVQMTNIRTRLVKRCQFYWTYHLLLAREALSCLHSRSAQLTMDAQTSDGFQYLSDVNLIKVNFINHLSAQIKQEQEIQWTIQLKLAPNLTN